MFASKNMVIIIILVVDAVLIFLLLILNAKRKYIKRQEENEKLIDEMCNVFAKCIDMKDPYTNGHSERVAKYTVMLARRLGKSKSEVRKLYHIALLHDIGKISIPDAILNKDSDLTDEEYEIVKNHAARGGDILKDITIAPNLGLGAKYHHERIDGKGYPDGLKGEDIPEEAQIIAVADTFDAMYSTRPYRERMDLKVVAEEIGKAAGTQLNEKIVKVFLELVDEGAFSDENLAKDIWQEEA
ncbi:MAG: HD-GYP domain-containing protein [Lachnospiraceae bacterium]|nr:HD-GYP domain-containing protein [Lachnospiraceae bacterium]